MRNEINLKTCLVISIFLLAMVSTVAGRIIFVDADAPGLTHDGTRWANAYKYLQDALADANSNADVNEICVAQGIYKPDQNSAAPNGSGDREVTFQLINGVALKGGYAGFGEPDPNTRDIELYETILSGDLAGNDGSNFANNNENSYHVVTGSGTDPNAMLDGFTITAGNANEDLPSPNPNGDGGGMYNYSGSPTVTNCTFSGNAARVFGGGMLNDRDSSPTLTNCVFKGNLSDNHGGGMSNVMSSPTLTNCTFSGNRAVMAGGMHNFMRGNPTLTNCTFIGNTARWYGGGMRNKDWSSPTLTNCTFSRNAVTDIGGSGGAMRSVNWSRPTLTNCTFAANSATNGSALACGSYEQSEPSNVQLTNCILWDSGDEIWNEDNSVITITYSDIQGGWPSPGNIDADPCFADPAGGDYHLKSQAGRWDPASQTWVEDAGMSPAIDGGNPASDWTAELWPHGKRINMGVYGGTPQASMSLSDAGNIANLDTDGYIGYGDMMLFTDKWLYEAVLLSEDLGRDGFVDFTDFAIFACNWRLPGQASSPHPYNLAGGVELTADLSWTAGSGATLHDVYFGTSSSPPFVCNQTATTFEPGTMTMGTTYYWRVDAVNAAGKTTGKVWRFTTFGPPP